MKRVFKVIPCFAVFGLHLLSIAFSSTTFADKPMTPFVSRTVEVAGVKPDNIKGLMAQAEIDGALVGGASPNPEAFASIVNF